MNHTRGSVLTTVCCIGSKQIYDPAVSKAGPLCSDPTDSLTGAYFTGIREGLCRRPEANARSGLEVRHRHLRRKTHPHDRQWTRRHSLPTLSNIAVSPPRLSNVRRCFLMPGTQKRQHVRILSSCWQRYFGGRVSAKFGSFLPHVPTIYSTPRAWSVVLIRWSTLRCMAWAMRGRGKPSFLFLYRHFCL